MVFRPRNGISLCAGGGGLDLGVQLAEPAFACRCFVECEPSAQAVLVGGMGIDAPGGDASCVAGAGLFDGSVAVPHDPAHIRRHARPFHQAALWDDVRTFVGDGWRGHINLVSAGYPCQPFSAAGKRAGSDDERHLWPDVARILWETGAEWGFFENVAGHISLGLETVLRDLWDMGWTPAVGLFSSAETGATHERQRVFIVAHRQGDDRRGQHEPRGAGRGRAGSAGGGRELADASSGGGGKGPGISSEAQTAEITTRRWGRVESGNGGSELADASQSRSQGREQPGASGERNGSAAHGSAAQRGRPWLSPPGPSDSGAWGHILRVSPDLAPSFAFRDLVSRAGDLAAMVAEGRVAETQAQSDLRRMADALAARPRALRLYGNGVDPMVAAHAWRSLAAAHGLRPVDLETTNRRTHAGAGEFV